MENRHWVGDIILLKRAYTGAHSIDFRDCQFDGNYRQWIGNVFFAESAAFFAIWRVQRNTHFLHLQY